MAEDQNPVENVEIEPLSDEDLEEVAGGGTYSPNSSGGCCSCQDCS